MTLIVKSAIFNSPAVKGLKMVNKKFYDTPDSLPKKETNQIIKNSKVLSEFSTSTSANGDRLEVYITPEETIRFSRNRFGEIKEFSSSNPEHNNAPETAIEKIRMAFAEIVKSVLK